MKVDHVMNYCHVLVGTPLGADSGESVLIELCVKDFKSLLELATKGIRHAEVREEIMSFIERHRDTFGAEAHGDG